ncbi:MAG TPA: DUF1552 domain-containing protein [Polyangiaceae bacterium]|nr:DUF1552 domain-containing protein [Polyangiaceae bacterium]
MKSSIKNIVSRRAVLRGAGVCLALPWLESFAPRGAKAQAAATPKRYLFCTFTNGAAGHWWENAPAFGTSVFGDQFMLSSSLAPLAPVKDKLLVVSRISNYSWNTKDPTMYGIGPSHSRCPAALHSCVDTDDLATKAGMDLPSAVINSVTADQVIVQNANFGTPIESMQVGLGSFPGAFDGRSYADSQVMSWKSGTEPLKRQINPKAVFDMMVNAGATNSTGAVDPNATAAAQARAAENQSVLDAVQENADSIKLKMSREDQITIQKFQDGLRGIEMQVTNVAPAITAGCQVIAAPGAVPEPGGAMQGLNQGQMGYDRQAHAAVMNDLVTMALQCDLTRVITYMLEDSRSEFNYTFIGPDDAIYNGIGGIDNFHGGGQHGPGAVASTSAGGVYPMTSESNGGYATITRWTVRKVSELAQKLAAIPEGAGTVLDNTLIVMVNDMRSHDHKNFDLPLFMLGGTGFIKQNGHIALAEYPGDRQIRDLYYTIMNGYFNLNVASFGNDLRGTQNAMIEDILA